MKQHFVHFVGDARARPSAREMTDEARQPFRVFETEEDFQAAVDSFIGKRLGILRRAASRAAELQREVEDLRRQRDELQRELHTGGTRL